MCLTKQILAASVTSLLACTALIARADTNQYQGTTAADFMEMCSPMKTFDAAGYTKELQRLKAEKHPKVSGEEAYALMAVTYCTTLVSGITNALAGADNYRLKGGHPVCVDPQESGLKTLQYLVGYGEAHQDMVKDPTWDAPAFVIVALGDRPCPLTN